MSRSRSKEILSEYKGLVWSAIIHAGIFLCSIALAYNTYKEVMREYSPLSRAIRDDIQENFPWLTLLFVILFFLYGMGRSKEKYPSFRNYAAIIIVYMFFANLIYSFTTAHNVIVINLGAFYFVVFLLAWSGAKKIIHIDHMPKGEDFLPPVIYTPLQANMPKVREYFKAKPSAPFIIGFMFLLVMCAFLLIFEQESDAEQVANIAYLLLVIGVGIEVYQLIRERNREDDESSQ